MIERDGQNTSLWQANVNPYITKNSGDIRALYDVILVGGGITGISTALMLQRSGKKCLVIEAAGLCFGTTGGTTAHLNTLLDTSYFDIAKKFGKEAARLVASVAGEALQLIKNNIDDLAIDCEFREASAFLFATDKKQTEELKEINDASLNAGLDIDYTDQIPIPTSFQKAVKVQGQGKFNPVKYVYGIAAAFESLGGIILQHCRMTGAEQNEVITVETENGMYRGIDLIYASHIPPGVNLLDLRCIPYRSYVMAFTLEDNHYPSDLCYDMADPYYYYRTQEVDRRPYLIAGGKDHKTAHENNEEACFTSLESHLRQIFNISEINYKWSSQYYEPVDGLPYIGHLPGNSEHIYVATGYGGNGMTYSSVAAIILSSLILNKKNPYENLFDPNRIKPVAGFENFIKHNADVVSQYFGKIFSGEKLEALTGLSRGEAKVVDFEGQKIGLYKDEEGKLFAVNPVCTHLGCEVKWNNAEKSWDCPCHGARYYCTGKVLTGPADRNLESVNIQSLVEK
jgi:glycine/D-amino acid oxidase-like deaminating enzyme/nitrite reductase/ring-hydroxylating ferredoxin subunit